MAIETLESVRKALPLDGMSRWAQIAPFSPFGREKFRQLVRAGKAPQPVKFSLRCTAYPNTELHKFFADPLHYRAPQAERGLAAYEAAKHAWRMAHPDATPAQYSAAMQRIAAQCGV